MKNLTKFFGVIALSAVIGFSFAVLCLTGCGDGGGGGGSSGNKSSILHTKVNKILNEKDEEVRLVGVNICSLEWSSEGENVLASTREVFTNWNYAPTKHHGAIVKQRLLSYPKN